MDHAHSQPGAVAELEAPEAGARTSALEKRLGNQERQGPVGTQVVQGGPIHHQHREILLAAAESRLVAAQREETVVAPQWQGRTPVVVRQALPVHPGRVADDQVEPLRTDKDRREIVLDDPRPDAVSSLHVEFAQLRVQLHQQVAVTRLEWRHGALNCLEQTRRIVVRSHGALQCLREAAHLCRVINRSRDEEAPDAGGELTPLTQ